MPLRILVFLVVFSAVFVLPGGQQLFGAEPLPPERAANPGGFERQEPSAPARPPAGTRPGVPGAAPVGKDAPPAAASDAAAGVSYQYDALGRIREIVRVPGR
ncbi:MAG: hypothetical protein MUD16_15440 [Desulfobacterales bacterium]|jgi:hypothetical protein|nr:hypothetical protein [Desulfobacterales bacterium]